MTLGELLAVLVGRLYSNVATDPPGEAITRGNLEKRTIYSIVFKMFFLCCHGHQLMFAVTGSEKKKKIALQYTHTHVHTYTQPILCPSIKTEVVLAPGQLEAGPWEGEERGT